MPLAGTFLGTLLGALIGAAVVWLSDRRRAASSYRDQANAHAAAIVIACADAEDDLQRWERSKALLQQDVARQFHGSAQPGTSPHLADALRPASTRPLNSAVRAALLSAARPERHVFASLVEVCDALTSATLEGGLEVLKAIPDVIARWRMAETGHGSVVTELQHLGALLEETAQNPMASED